MTKKYVSGLFEVCECSEIFYAHMLAKLYIICKLQSDPIGAARSSSDDHESHGWSLVLGPCMVSGPCPCSPVRGSRSPV